MVKCSGGEAAKSKERTQLALGTVKRLLAKRFNLKVITGHLHGTSITQLHNDNNNNNNNKTNFNLVFCMSMCCREAKGRTVS